MMWVRRWVVSGGGGAGVCGFGCWVAVGGCWMVRVLVVLVVVQLSRLEGGARLTLVVVVFALV